jgi:hypothetical protein
VSSLRTFFDEKNKISLALLLDITVAYEQALTRRTALFRAGEAKFLQRFGPLEDKPL